MNLYLFSLFLQINRTNNFHHFVKLALTKNPKKRPTAEKLLQVSKKGSDSYQQTQSGLPSHSRPSRSTPSCLSRSAGRWLSSCWIKPTTPITAPTMTSTTTTRNLRWPLRLLLSQWSLGAEKWQFCWILLVSLPSVLLVFEFTPSVLNLVSHCSPSFTFCFTVFLIPFFLLLVFPAVPFSRPPPSLLPLSFLSPPWSSTFSLV